MRDDCACMTAPGDNGEPSVLAKLPRARPQRPSARRAAARKAAADSDARATQAAAKRTPPRTAAAAPREPPAPRQGYETEDTIEPGVAVQPPSGTELATSAAELIGELAQAGLETGGRLLRDALGRLPGL
jgi:hypothetical protein